MMECFGFVGLGEMGSAIASRAIDAGVPTTLWARRHSTLVPYVAGPATLASDLAAVARQSDVVGVCVFDDADVRDVALGPAGLLASMRPGSVLLVHSTVSVAVCHELAGAAEPADVSVLDAPVTGGRQRALAGELAVMVGGPVAALERARPILTTYATTIRHLGALGAGQTAKALNSALHWATGEVGLVVLDLCREFGLDGAAAVDVLRAGAAGSRALDLVADRLTGDVATAEHVKNTVAKDLAVLTELLDSRQIDGGNVLGFAQARMARDPAAPIG